MSDGWRSKIWIKWPFAMRLGLSGDGNWTLLGKPLAWAGWNMQHDVSGKCLTIWIGPAAIWIAKATALNR